MKVKSLKPKGSRIKYSDPRPFSIEPIEKDWNFDTTLKCWIKGYNFNNEHGYSSCYYSMKCHRLHDAHSLKAAKRLISKWNVPKGMKFKVRSQWMGYDFIITKS